MEEVERPNAEVRSADGKWQMANGRCHSERAKVIAAIRRLARPSRRLSRSPLALFSKDALSRLGFGHLRSRLGESAERLPGADGRV